MLSNDGAVKDWRKMKSAAVKYFSDGTDMTKARDRALGQDLSTLSLSEKAGGEIFLPAKDDLPFIR